MEYIQLKEIVDIYLGLTHTPKYVEEGIPFLSVKDISDGKIDFSNCHYITEEEYKSLPKGARPQKGDMLFCRIGTIGKPIIIDENIRNFGSFVSLGFFRKKNNEYLLEYLKYWMNSQLFEKQVKQNVKGVAQINLNTGWLKEFIVPKKNVNEQIVIINQLDIIQETIDIRKKQIEQLDELIKSQFVEMFGDIKNDDFDNSQIKNLVDTNIIKTKKKFKKNDVIKYIDISSIDNIKNEIIGFTEYKIGDEPSRAQQCLVKGDILISTVRPNLKNIAVNDYNDENIIGSSGFCVLRPNKCELEYLLAVVKSEKFTNDMVAKTTGANYPAIHSTDILNYEIAVPPIELQNQFANIVKQINKQKFEIQKSLEETQKLQDSLMNKYFG